MGFSWALNGKSNCDYVATIWIGANHIRTLGSGTVGEREQILKNEMIRREKMGCCERWVGLGDFTALIVCAVMQMSQEK